MANGPVEKFRIGYVTASVWRNTNGENVFYTVEVQRAYKDGNDIKNTPSLNHADILNAAKALERAEAWIANQ